MCVKLNVSLPLTTVPNPRINIVVFNTGIHVYHFCLQCLHYSIIIPTVSQKKVGISIVTKFQAFFLSCHNFKEQKFLTINLVNCKSISKNIT